MAQSHSCQGVPTQEPARDYDAIATNAGEHVQHVACIHKLMARPAATSYLSNLAVAMRASITTAWPALPRADWPEQAKGGKPGMGSGSRCHARRHEGRGLQRARSGIAGERHPESSAQWPTSHSLLRAVPKLSRGIGPVRSDNRLRTTTTGCSTGQQVATHCNRLQHGAVPKPAGSGRCVRAVARVLLEAHELQHVLAPAAA